MKNLLLFKPLWSIVLYSGSPSTLLYQPTGSAKGVRQSKVRTPAGLTGRYCSSALVSTPPYTRPPVSLERECRLFKGICELMSSLGFVCPFVDFPAHVKDFQCHYFSTHSLPRLSFQDFLYLVLVLSPAPGSSSYQIYL